MEGIPPRRRPRAGAARGFAPKCAVRRRRDQRKLRPRTARTPSGGPSRQTEAALAGRSGGELRSQRRHRPPPDVPGGGRLLPGWGSSCAESPARSRGRGFPAPRVRAVATKGHRGEVRSGGRTSCRPVRAPVGEAWGSRAGRHSIFPTEGAFPTDGCGEIRLPHARGEARRGNRWGHHARGSAAARHTPRFPNRRGGEVRRLLLFGRGRSGSGGGQGQNRGAWCAPLGFPSSRAAAMASSTSAGSAEAMAACTARALPRDPRTSASACPARWRRA